MIGRLSQRVFTSSTSKRLVPLFLELPFACHNNTLQSNRTYGKLNCGINFVPQQEAWVIERMGKYLKTLKPGLNLLIPILDSIKYVQPLKEMAMEIPEQSAITLDNVQLVLDGVLYIRVIDPFKASYGVEDPEFAVKQLAQTTMRSEVGKIILDTVFKEREQLNASIVEAINKAAEPWGLVCLRYEIRDMKMPKKIQEAMQLQVEAERRKRAAILESEGKRDAAVNHAEGEKKARILASEANMQEEINAAKGIAQAYLLEADARRKAYSLSGPDAVNLKVAELAINAFEKLAKQNNTVLLPADGHPASTFIAQATAVYKTLVSGTSAVNIPTHCQTQTDLSSNTNKNE